MLRNDLITLLAEHDNDNVAICINGLQVDLEAVVGSGHGIEIRPDPESLRHALDACNREEVNRCDR